MTIRCARLNVLRTMGVHRQPVEDDRRDLASDPRTRHADDRANWRPVTGAEAARRRKAGSGRIRLAHHSHLRNDKVRTTVSVRHPATGKVCKGRSTDSSPDAALKDSASRSSVDGTSNGIEIRGVLEKDSSTHRDLKRSFSRRANPSWLLGCNDNPELYPR